MIKRLIRWCVPEEQQTYSTQIRQRCGTLSGSVGVVLNLLLFAGKLLAGALTASIAVVADAFNNLSDAGTSIVTLVGFRLAGQEADREHPFGHGRMEYLSGLVVSLAILLVGFELGKTSLEKIFYPQPVSFSWLSAGILAAAVLVKLWLYRFNRELSRRIDSAAVAATAADSLVDAAATTLVLLSNLASHWFELQIDGYMGVLVAGFIFKAGWEAARETMDPLLGRPMAPELARDIDRIVLEHPYILGIHDLVYHDYGPGRAMMSFHAEVPADGNLLEMHDVIDHIERELKEHSHIETVIHMDPVVCDERTDQLRIQVCQAVRQLDPILSVHDFRITAGPMHTNLIFDVVVPYGFRLTDAQVRDALVKQIRAMSEQYYAVIEIDHSYVEEDNPPSDC